MISVQRDMLGCLKSLKITEFSFLKEIIYSKGDYSVSKPYIIPRIDNNPFA
jgi:hypothetical protein